MSANETQIGGRHYKTDYEHWDLVLNTGMGYFEGQITRYVSRWRRKNGMEDLEKALHYINKFLEWVERGHDRTELLFDRIEEYGRELKRFARINGLFQDEEDILHYIVCWTVVGHITRARDLLVMLMESVDNAAKPSANELTVQDFGPFLDEPKPVPLTEENHYSPREGQEDETQS